jgi:hypothetical protein
MVGRWRRATTSYLTAYLDESCEKRGAAHTSKREGQAPVCEVPASDKGVTIRGAVRAVPAERTRIRVVDGVPAWWAGWLAALCLSRYVRTKKGLDDVSIEERSLNAELSDECAGAERVRNRREQASTPGTSKSSRTLDQVQDVPVPGQCERESLRVVEGSPMEVPGRGQLSLARITANRRTIWAPGCRTGRWLVSV